MSLNIIQDKDRPGEAYVQAERAVIIREMWISAGALALAIVFWLLGRKCDVPF